MRPAKPYINFFHWGRAYKWNQIMYGNYTDVFMNRDTIFFFPRQIGNFYSLGFMIPTKYSNFVVVVAVLVFWVSWTNSGIK